MARSRSIAFLILLVAAPAPAPAAGNPPGSAPPPQAGGAGQGPASVRVMGYLYKGVPNLDLNETTFRVFLYLVGRTYAKSELSVNFSLGRAQWVDPEQGETCGRMFYGNDVTACVGPGQGGFFASPWFRVGLNTDPPFGYSGIGVNAAAHEFGHFLGMQDLYWLQTAPPLVAPTPAGLRGDIMFSPAPAANSFTRYSRAVLKMNLDRLKNGRPIVYPRSRAAKRLSVDIGIPNRRCEIHARDRDAAKSMSIVHARADKAVVSDGTGRFEFDVFARDPEDDNFDLYYVWCGSLAQFWISSLATDDCYLAGGASGGTCAVQCGRPGDWCRYGGAVGRVVVPPKPEDDGLPALFQPGQR